MPEMNGSGPPVEKLDQLEMLRFGFDYAINEVGKSATAAGQVPDGNAIVIALASKLGEVIAGVPNRLDRRRLFDKVAELIRTTSITALRERN